MNAPQSVFPRQRYGRLIVIEEAGRNLCGHRRFECRCDCGTVRVATACDLRSGHTRSCGCLAREMLSRRRTTHGYSRGDKRSPEYSAWAGMIQRCTNPRNDSYKRYGGRGIKVCERWRNSFADFRADVGERPGPGYSLDRTENDGHYEPGNARWATLQMQSRNKCNNRIVLHEGTRMPLVSACEITGVNYDVAKARLRSGWPVERALSPGA